MATSESKYPLGSPQEHVQTKYPLGSPQEHVQMCDKHTELIDMFCEDCKVFICSECAKTDHRDHRWVTIVKAASDRRRQLQKLLSDVKKENLPKIDEGLKKSLNQIKENERLCGFEVETLQKQVDEITEKLLDIKKRHEKAMEDNLSKKNDEVNLFQSQLDKKRKQIVDLLSLMEENNRTMSDYSLIDNHRELKQQLADVHTELKNCEYSMRYGKGEIKENLVESLFGQTFDLDDISATETDSFSFGNKLIFSMKAVNEECHIRSISSKVIERVSKQGEQKHTVNVEGRDFSISENGYVFFTDEKNCLVKRLSASGSVSRITSTDPLVPVGICQSLVGGLLITLRDKAYNFTDITSIKRSFVRHMTLNGDVIREYEYQEDGHTRLFTYAYKVIQNGNTDICVVNGTGNDTGNLLLMSYSGRLKSVYDGQNLSVDFKPHDMVSDSRHNLIVTDAHSDCIHLLSPEGAFLKFLLREEAVFEPTALSLCLSTLWVGNSEGLVKVFCYKNAR